MNNYSFLITLKHGIKYAAIVLLSVIVAGIPVEYPELWNFTIGTTTIGALIVMILNYLKHKLGFRLP